MKNNRKKVILVIVGILLIAIQVINYCGVSRMYTGILPDNEHLLYPNYMMETSTLNIKELFFAFEAGADRFISGFEDLTYPLDEWRVISSTQYASAFIRESLGCSNGGSFGLIVYDFFVLLSYWVVGIIGIILLIIATKTKTISSNENGEKTSTDEVLENSEDETTLDHVEKIAFCRKCGESLGDSDKSCRKCGTEIVEEVVLVVAEENGNKN